MVGHREGELQPGNQQRVFQDLSSCGFRDQATGAAGAAPDHI
jgi:hypothetical protein